MPPIPGFLPVGEKRIFLKDNAMNYLRDHRLEIENRIRNLFWTVSGDYSLSIKPDAETFVRSKALALYDAIKQGAFVGAFRGEELAMYAMKKRALGADEAVLMELIRLCVDAAAYPKVSRERSGIREIRQQAFADDLEAPVEPGALPAIRRSLMERFLGREDSCPEELKHFVTRIETLADAEDTAQIIRTVDALYNDLPDAPGKQLLEQVQKLTLEELLDYQRYQELSQDQMEQVLGEYLSALKDEMLRMKTHRSVDRRFVPTILPEDEPEAPEPQQVEKVYAFMERQFGKSYLSRAEQERLNRLCCTGIHRRCSLYLTEGILSNPAMKNTQYLRTQMQSMKNELYFNTKYPAIRRSVAVLASILKRVLIQRQDEDSVRAEYGQIVPSRLWKLGKTNDSKLFDARKKRDDRDFVVELLLDGSGSQIIRQPQIAAQAYIISQALSEAGIPHRVSSFCSYWDYTAIHRFRNYDDPAEANRNILQFRAFGENRDGLAIRYISDELLRRSEERKVLIILSDGRPHHLGTDRAGSRKPAPYVGEEALRDTAQEVRRARAKCISVLGVFVGSEADLGAEKRIFGKEFVYTRSISSFAHIVGNYLRRQMEQ